MVLLELRGFTREDYAALHPGGVIGQTLLLRVADIMRKEERAPLVPGEATVQEALVAMTHARAGCACVVNPDRSLAGIFTDGDFRRHTQQDAGLLSKPVRSVMTERPVVIGHQALAAEALRVFQEHSIDDLVVVDDHLHVVGLLDIQDLPKLKIL